MTFKDRTYCASPDCNNKCGRKMGEEERHALAYCDYQVVSYGYFCGENIEARTVSQLHDPRCNATA